MAVKNIIIALALASAAAAMPNISPRDDCQATYTACVAAGTNEIACGCDLAACVGEDNARERSYCATATASLAPSSARAPPFSSISGIPGGCNPAHPGSCPTSYFTAPAVTTA